MVFAKWIKVFWLDNQQSLNTKFIDNLFFSNFLLIWYKTISSNWTFNRFILLVNLYASIFRSLFSF